MKPVMNSFSSSYNISMLFLVFLIICLTQPQGTNSLFNTFRVHVSNGFTNETLTAHCQSKDTDLHNQELTVNNEFWWEFRVQLGDKTLFFCNLWWKGGHKTFDAFLVDDKFLAQCMSNDCMWRARDDGVYLFNFPHKEFRLKYKWEPW